MKNILTISIFFLSLSGFTQSDDAFERGNAHYRDGAYEEAVAAWEEVLGSGRHSAALYYNLGNAYYKLNEVAPSIYYYEKALKLAPGDAEIKNNLAFAQNRTIDLIEPLPEPLFTKWRKNISGVMSYNGWAWMTLLFSVLTVVLFFGYYFVYTERKKKWLFASSAVSLGCMVICLFLAALAYSDYKNDRPAIIFTEQTEVMSEPTHRGSVSFVLHEGTKVQVTDREGNWVRILLADGKEGWMSEGDLKLY